MIRNKFNLGRPNSRVTDGCLLNSVNAELSCNFTDVICVRLFTLTSFLFGLCLLFYFISAGRYVIIGQFPFLIVSLLYCAVELMKYETYRVKMSHSLSFKNFSALSFIGVFIPVVGCTYALTVLFGADLKDNFAATLVFSCHFSTFILIPLYFHAGKRCLRVLLMQETPKSHVESSILVVSIGFVVGSWLGAFVIPLDWDRDWQKWPISCVIGSIFGFITGNLVCFLSTFVKTNPLNRMLSSIIN